MLIKKTRERKLLQNLLQQLKTVNNIDQILKLQKSSVGWKLWSPLTPASSAIGYKNWNLTSSLQQNALTTGEASTLVAASLA